MTDHGARAHDLKRRAQEIWRSVSEELPHLDGAPVDAAAREVDDLRTRSRVLFLDIEMLTANVTEDLDVLQEGVERLGSDSPASLREPAERIRDAVRARRDADEAALDRLLADVTDHVDAYAAWADEHRDRFAELRIALAEEGPES